MLKSVLFVTVLASSLVSLAFPAGTRNDTLEGWKSSVGWNGVVTPLAHLVSRDSSSEAQALEGGVYMCRDLKWGGECVYTLIPYNQCTTLGPAWANAFSSFGPDPCTRCDAFSSPDCGRDEATLKSKGYWGFFDYPGDATGGAGTAEAGTTDFWDRRIESFHCSASPLCE